MDRMIIHTSGGAAMLSAKCPKNHLMPSLLRSERTPDVGMIELIIHEASTSSTCARTRTADNIDSFFIIPLRFVGMQIVDVYDTQFQSLHYEPCGVDADAAVANGKQFLHQFVLSLLKTLNTEGHAP